MVDPKAGGRVPGQQLVRGVGCCSTSVLPTGKHCSCGFEFWNGDEELGHNATGMVSGEAGSSLSGFGVKQIAYKLEH